MSTHKSEIVIASLCLLKGAMAVEAMGDRLDTRLFQSAECRRVVDYVVERVDAGHFVDLSTIKGEHVIDDVMLVMSDKNSAADASIHHLPWHLEQIEEAAKRARLDAVADKIKDRILQEDLGALEEEVFAMLSEDTEQSAGTQSCHDVCLAAMGHIEKRYTGEESGGFDVGLKQLQAITKGCVPGQLMILAARPGMGKSMLAGAMARNAIVHGSARVHITSLEMSTTDWIDRLIQSYASRNINEVIEEQDASGLAMLSQAAGNVARLNLTISDRGGLSKSGLIRQVKREASRGANFFILDHLGLLDLPRKDVHTEIGKVTGQLKTLAKKLKVFFLVVVQLNRKAEESMRYGNSEPSLMHLAESDGPGRDADVVLMIDMDQNLHVVKNRNGPTGKIDMEMDGRYMSVKEADA